MALKPFDADGGFRPVDRTGGMRRSAVRGAGATVFAQVSAFAVQMIATVVLARLLVPADFGLVTMVTTFSVLLMSCGRVGIPDAVLQREEMNRYLASNLFWINVGTGLCLTGLLATAGSLLARFYGDPRVAHVTVGVSLTILIDSTSVLHLALLKRAMRFSAVAANDITARAASVVVSILLGWRGWGYWALVAGAIALPLSTSLGAWVLCRWIPSLPRRAAGTVSMIRFAVHVFGRYTLNYGSQNTDNLLVGWRFGSVALGLYKKAYDLFVLPFSLLSVYPVAVSTLSRLTKDRLQYRRYFLGGLSVLAFVGLGMGADFTLVGRDLVRILLGSRWDEAGRIFMFFGPGIGAQLIYSTYGIIHLSIGTTGRFLRWGFVELTVTILLFLLAIHWGPVGFAVAWSVSYWILIIPAFWYAGRPIGLGVGAVVRVVWKYFLASVISGFACAAIIREFALLLSISGPVGAAARILVTTLLFAVLYIGMIILLHGGFEPIYQFGRVLAEMLPSKRSVSPPTPLTQGDDSVVMILTQANTEEATTSAR